MEVCIIKIALLCLVSLTMVYTIHAQNSPQDFLRPHNAARAEVGVGQLQWDDGVARYAENYANQIAATCNMVHSGGPYGENIAMSTGDMTAATAVNLWVGEKADYDYNSNTCNGDQCGHYTQVVWRNSVKLGCASVRCNTGGTFVTCNYDPPGNFNGQRPY